ncbi:MULTISPECIES: aldo/keto reductase [Pseudonocardia]|uniref:General stress protein 69 n=2 Tax=Pseudonocardia TaxID=1847 RepID=A0A1Y2MSX4_PSEAH|nr:MULTISPECIES: aldo/keto reductase [Pseudonocardia]OSY37837.1 General stress protein 69 [Pseudonocardia autotrophica]TDN72500.1 aryl-alcohol dehydrogenase-like predicted oxidoreductase [Pseudonocardia autotrophica]BBG03209.1 oxidoreductase [Pseudonocardia autotrophica]GEC23826.1 oxidoreductase [Pseudonocardia saturnea]
MSTPQIVLGAMNFGTRVDTGTAFDLLDRFVERGGEWIDTADVYAFWNDPSGDGGQSERVIGSWLAARPGVRDRVRISTKTGVRGGLGPATVTEAAAGSLRRLGTERVDLYWAHTDDRDADPAATAEVFGGLVERGIADRIGASNHTSWRVQRLRGLAAARGIPAFGAVQLRHSYVVPRPGAALPDVGHVLLCADAADLAAAENLELWAYTPLVNGALSRTDRTLPEAYDHPGTVARLAALDAVAADLGATRNQVVLAWLLAGGSGRSGRTGDLAVPPAWPLVGVSGIGQLDEVLDARDLVLDAAARERLDTAA